MAGEIDIFLAEKQSGTDFSRRLSQNVRKSIQNLTNKRTGTALKSKVKPVFKAGFLHSLEIYTPYYIYPILHYGFEGSKKNGVAYRMKARNIITDALENGKFTQDLADAVGNQRAEAIVSRINFSFDKEDKDLKTSNSL